MFKCPRPHEDHMFVLTVTGQSGADPYGQPEWGPCDDCEGLGELDHIKSCAQREWRYCTVGNGKSHRWSGWPGAYCQDCGIEDKNEACIGCVCECPCHDQFWEDYANYLKEHDDGLHS